MEARRSNVKFIGGLLFSCGHCIIKINVSNNLKNWEPKKFWENISKLNKKSQNVCSVIDDKVGSECCDAFYSKYKKLYNINPSENIELIQESLKTKIRNCCTNHDESNPGHLHKVTPELVKCGVKK